MESLLNALQDGRLIELPDEEKSGALELLATLIEAIPGATLDEGISEKVLARERVHNTGIGRGWACPHARCARDGELLCAVGWSPAGIAYDAPDGKPVHLVVMYFVPDTQKNRYLKEISSLAKAIQSQPALENPGELKDLADVRHSLLDAITIALESTAPDAVARMIHLQVRQAESPEPSLPEASSGRFVPFTLIVWPGGKSLVLAQDADLVRTIEDDASLAASLEQTGRAECQGMHLLVRHKTEFRPDRRLYECLAVRPG